MAQNGVITSVTPGLNHWWVQYKYQRDTLVWTEAQVVVGDAPYPPFGGPGSSGQNPVFPQTSAMWATADGTISVIPPGVSGGMSPVLLACPDIIKVARFGQKIKGFPPFDQQIP